MIPSYFFLKLFKKCCFLESRYSFGQLEERVAKTHEPSFGSVSYKLEVSTSDGAHSYGFFFEHNILFKSPASADEASRRPKVTSFLSCSEVVFKLLKMAQVSFKCRVFSVSFLLSRLFWPENEDRPFHFFF